LKTQHQFKSLQSSLIIRSTYFEKNEIIAVGVSETKTDAFTARFRVFSLQFVNIYITYISLAYFFNFATHCNLRPLDVAPVVLSINYDIYKIMHRPTNSTIPQPPRTHNVQTSRLQLQTHLFQLS